jgi:hypothetical protein
LGTVRGYRQGENPARWRGHLDKVLPKPSKVRTAKHHAALPFDKVNEFVRDLRDREAIAALRTWCSAAMTLSDSH